MALNPGIASPGYSLPLRRLLGLVAAGLDVSLIPVTRLPGRIVRLGAQQMIHAAFACLAATVKVVCGVVDAAGVGDRAAGGGRRRAAAQRNPGPVA